jgi:uncharacterized phage-like protein YoqJ
MTILAFTGHRPNKLGGYKLPNPTYMKVCQQIESIILELKPLKIISGMALGVDQWAAFIAIKLGVPFIAAVPFKKQESKWPIDSQRIFNQLIQKAEEVILVSPGEYSVHKMQIRNEWMVDNCDQLVAVWDGTAGGTANCINYAKSKNKNIIYVNLH